MKLKNRLLLLLTVFSLLVTSCTNVSIPTNANTAFKNFTLTLFQQDVASTTLGLHYTVENPDAYGIKEYSITYGSFDTDETSTLASLENFQTVLNKFSYESLSMENKITYDVLSSYLKTSMDGVKFALYEEPLSPLTGIHAQLPVLLAEYTFNSQEDVETYLKLIETTPEYFHSLIKFEQKKADAGLFMADYAVDSVLEQCNAFLSMGDNNYLLSTFEERLESLESLPLTDKSNYITRNQQLLQSAILPAYEQLVSALQKLKGSGKNEMGLCYLPAGKDYYAHLVSRETGSALSVPEIITLIEEYIASDILDMQSVAAKNPSIIEDVSTSSDSSPDVILKNLKEKIIFAFPETKNVTVEIKYVPSALEPYLSPAFYLIPSIDNSTNNVIYINQAHAMDDIHLFTTLAHEGYPGHLYQTTYYASKNPDPLRTLFNFKGYVEGWATYAEMCSYYLSSLDKSYATLLQKNSSLILGLYAMADIGIHYQGWNLDRTKQFFSTYGIEDKTTIQEIYNLIIGDPANYLSYYVGYLEILELKKDMIDKEGENFSQKRFHQMFLDIGPAPFDVVNNFLLGDVS